jgi:hypothetical protein
MNKIYVVLKTRNGLIEKAEAFYNKKYAEKYFILNVNKQYNKEFTTFDEALDFIADIQDGISFEFLENVKVLDKKQEEQI